jgi:phosphoadenylyl-sulfate reductase (thioredoxin)
MSIEITGLGATDFLRHALDTYGQRFAILTSFQLEGMVLVDMAVRISPAVRVLTIDTGRLPAETHAIMADVRSRYGVQIETIEPDAGEVERMTSRFGSDLFLEAVAYRKLCCEVRKVRPLARYLNSVDAYAVGLRREQSGSRADVEKVAEVHGRVKLSPLADWSAAQVEEYAQRNNVPRHPLYARGYTSIGCDPCTRATAAGEDERAGRWWWEADAVKECGLHVAPDGRMERELDVLLRDIGAMRS